MKRSRALFALTAMVTASLFLNIPAATATTNVAADASFDNGAGYDGRGDIVSHGADYRNNTVTVAVLSRIPTNPATDTNWINYLTAVIWNLDTNGDGEEDYYAIISNFVGVRASVYRSSDSVKMCDAVPDYDAPSGIIAVRFEASCIGTPPGFAIETGFLYSTSSTDSFDAAPDNFGYAAGVTRTVDAPPPPPPPTTTTTTTQPDPTFIPAAGGDGYWMLTEQGDVFAFGGAPHKGNELATTVARTHIEPSRSGEGYWILAESGAVHAKGDAQWFGSALNTLAKGETAESLSRTPTGQGYWIFTNRGRVFAYGDAQHFGDMSGVALNGPVLGSVATPTGKGYWMVGSDGGIFSFGDAVFHGSTGNMKLNKPVMAMAPAANGSGYWLVASDGGIFAYGDARFFGSMGATPLNKPISGMVPGTAGYMMVGQDGGIFSFGSVAFHGSLGANPPVSPVVSVALQP